MSRQTLSLFFIGTILPASRAFNPQGVSSNSFKHTRTCVFLNWKYNELLESGDAMVLLQQAQQLRSEADLIRKELDESEEKKRKKRIEDVDRWIDELLIKVHIDDSTEILNTEEQVAELIKDKRFAAEHINKIFDRICETSGKQSIDNCSPLISLLLDAACKVDCLEREENPNKRWNHRVERDLRKKLFAMGWGINLDDVQTQDRTRSITGDKDYM